MARLEDLTRGASVKGILPDGLVTVVDVQWHGSAVVELTYKDAAGRLGNELLYRAVTDYVREEFNRAEALQNNKQAGTVGFALTILQRRLASSPEAIYQSLRRRRERLESRLRELELLQRGGKVAPVIATGVPTLDAEDVEDLEDAPDNEIAAAEEEILDQATAARTTLGGQVFDVLGKLQFEGKPLRDLLIEAIRYGEQPEVRARLTQAIANAVDRSRLQDLLEERALAHDAMDASRVHRIREEMERAEARRLQPHYIETFFLEAFQRLGGSVKQREQRRYEVTHVPSMVRNRDRLIGIGEPVLPRYER
ncbi:MAG: hypothetical protein ACRERD_26685, partial [Candidatus Binatia bacterium]